MDVDAEQPKSLSNVDDWRARFSSFANSKPAPFPFPSHKIQSIETRRARMADSLILDVLLSRGGVRRPDMYFPPVDWVALQNLLRAIDQSAYDMLKKDCLVYILLKWAWDLDPRESNTGWEARFVQDRCIPPQFVALADAYWMLDTGAHLAKAVSILSDARLNRDYVSKILQALALSSSEASFADGTAPATCALVVKYVRTAKPMLNEPDDIDLYALSLVQLSFMDAWAFQKSFPEGSDTRERLFSKIVGWCLTPSPKQEPLAQLLSTPLSSYEAAFLLKLALPFQFSSPSGPGMRITRVPSNLLLPPQAISTLQDLLVVRAIQTGDYVGAIKLDRQFTSVSPPLGSGPSSSIAAQAISSARDAIDRKSIIQELFAALPPAERTLLEDEIGKVATGVRASAPTPRQVTSTTRRPLVPESSLSASWEDVGAGTASPAPSYPMSVSSVVSAGLSAKATPVPTPPINRVTQSPFSTPASTSRPQSVSVRLAPPVPKFTAFGSPIPSATGPGTSRGVTTERAKTLFPSTTVGARSVTTKSATHVSLFDTSGSAKNAPNAFYKPPLAPTGQVSLDVGSALASSSAAKALGQDTDAAKQNGKVQVGESDGEDVSMESGSDVEIIEDHRHESGGEESNEEEEEEEEEVVTDEDEDDTENFITQDKSGAADLTLPARHASEIMDEDDEPQLGFSVFSGNKNQARNGNASGRGKVNEDDHVHVLYDSSPPRTRVSPPREEDKSLSLSVNSTARSRQRVPPGAFHHDEEDDDEDVDEDRDRDQEVDNDNDNGEDEEEEDKDEQARLTTPINTPRRSTRTRMQAQTPSRPLTRSDSQRSTTTTGVSARSGRPSIANRSIPGSLIDDDEEDSAHQSDAQGDDETEMDEQEEEDDAITPLPLRAPRRTRSSGFVGATASKSRTGTKAAGKVTGTGSGTGTSKGKAKARPSEVRTPARRSSRLSMASSTSPDYNVEAASPTKLASRGTGSRASLAASGSAGSVATRSSTRRKR